MLAGLTASPGRLRLITSCIYFAQQYWLVTGAVVIECNMLQLLLLKLLLLLLLKLGWRSTTFRTRNCANTA